MISLKISLLIRIMIKSRRRSRLSSEDGNKKRTKEMTSRSILSRRMRRMVSKVMLVRLIGNGVITMVIMWRTSRSQLHSLRRITSVNEPKTISSSRKMPQCRRHPERKVQAKMAEAKEQKPEEDEKVRPRVASSVRATITGRSAPTSGSRRANGTA